MLELVWWSESFKCDTYTKNKTVRGQIPFHTTVYLSHRKVELKLLFAKNMHMQVCNVVKRAKTNDIRMEQNWILCSMKESFLQHESE